MTLSTCLFAALLAPACGGDPNASSDQSNVTGNECTDSEQGDGNEDIAHATGEGSISDAASAQGLEIDGALSPNDVDWYRIEARDESTASLEAWIRFYAMTFSAQSAAGYFQVCAYVAGTSANCIEGTPVGFDASTEAPYVPATLSGCCAVLTGDGDQADYELRLGLDDTWGDDTRPVYVSVMPTDSLSTDACYGLLIEGKYPG